MNVQYPRNQAGGAGQSAFPELSVVRLTRAIDVADRQLPSGARGTVVAAYSDMRGYEVEFEQPFHAVVTLDASDIAA